MINEDKKLITNNTQLIITKVLHIVWNPNIAINIGSFQLLWYGVFFATGLVLAGWYVWCRFKEYNIPQSSFELLIIYCFLGIFFGARLGHCLFYEPAYFLSRPLEMFLPIVPTDEGGYHFVGYHGLASHGGTLGVIIAILLFKWRTKLQVLSIMDFVAISTPLAGGFIRLGNLINSEIVGAPTNLPWAFVFVAKDGIPRHPAQLYEAIFYFILFFALAITYRKCKYNAVNHGFYLALSVIGVAVFRFLVEFIKEVQVDAENDMVLNIGQWLSIPFFVFGVILLFYQLRVVRKTKKLKNNI